MKALQERVEQLGKTCHLVLLGDINIAATDKDMYNPGHKEHKVLCLCTLEERQFYTDMLALGFKDAHREMYPGQKYYSWWKCFENCGLCQEDNNLIRCFYQKLFSNIT